MYIIYNMVYVIYGLPGGSDGKESACNVGDLGQIPELGRLYVYMCVCVCVCVCVYSIKEWMEYIYFIYIYIYIYGIPWWLRQ